MQIFKYFALALIAATAFSSHGTRAEPTLVTLAPINEWQVTRLETMCVARRVFGSPRQPTVLELRRYDHWSGGFLVMLQSAEFPLKPSEPTAVWRPGSRKIRSAFPFTGTTVSGKEWIAFKGSMVDEGAPWGSDNWDVYYARNGREIFERNLKTFDVTYAFDRPVSFEVGPMDGVDDDLDACMDDILRSRGIPEEDFTRSDLRVEMVNREVMKAELALRLPASAQMRSWESGARFIIYLDERAKAVDCVLSPIQGASEFAHWGCKRLLMSARFRFKDGEAHVPTFFVFDAN